MGLWVITIAVASSKWGERLGGFLIGIPSTSGLSFFFIGLFASPAAAVSTTDDFPLFMSLSGIFLLTFGYLSRRSFATGIGGGMLAWFVASFLVLRSGLDNFNLSLAGSAAIFVAVYYLFKHGLKPTMSEGDVRQESSTPLNFLRFILGGGIVSLAVILGITGIPVLSAIAASFPALSISALLAVRMSYKNEGTSHARGLTMSSTVSIAVMLIPFSIAVHYFYPVMGVVSGTVFAYAVACAIGLPYYFRLSDLLVPSFAERSSQESNQRSFDRSSS